MRLRACVLMAGIAAGLSLLGAGSAAAATVTVGSPLPGTLTPQTFGGSRTLTNTALAEPGATASSPGNGTIVSWKIVDASGGPLTLQVVHPTGSGTFTSTGSVISGPITSLGILTFQANLSIKKGDLIGLNPTASSDSIGGQFANGSFMGFPTELGGSPDSPNDTGTGEAGFNAQVLLNCVVPKLKNKKVGAAKKVLSEAGCAAPTLKKPKGNAGGNAKFVRKQNPAAGTEIAGDASEILKLGPKPKK
jgi:hypothetical protein